jgi:hypothetical protein
VVEKAASVASQMCAVWVPTGLKVDMIDLDWEPNRVKFADMCRN